MDAKVFIQNHIYTHRGSVNCSPAVYMYLRASLEIKGSS